MANTYGPPEVGAVLCSVALSHAGGENGASSAINERALLQWNTLTLMQPRDICGNKMVPVRQKDYCRPSGERTKLFTDNDFPSVRYNP